MAPDAMGQRPLAVASVSFCLLVGAASLPPQATARERSEVQRRSFVSAALGAERRYEVYLPAEYATSERRYPVVYVLHGLGGGEREFFGVGGLPRTLDRLIARGAIEPLIAVAPDGDNSYWINHHGIGDAAGPRFGDYVVIDLVAEIDARFRTRAERSGRALAGVSMGGFGALSLALTHPRRYAVAVSLSGALFTRPPTSRALFRPIWGHPPDPATWRATSPLELLSALGSTSERPALYLHCGRSDGLRFMRLARKAHAILVERGIEHRYHVTAGGHHWRVWRAVAPDWLRFVDAQLKPPAAAGPP